MKIGPYLRILFMNGSEATTPGFHSVRAAIEYARDNVSYSGGRVRQVSLIDGRYEETLWSSAWDDVSNSASLHGFRD